MKKLIYVALVIVSAGALSSFTMKHGTAVAKHDTVSGKTALGTADGKTALGTADGKTALGTADARRAANRASDRTALATAD
jgi:hypothetical protein